MTATFQVWDDDTGNVVARYETQAEAVAFLQAMLDRNGPTGVCDLAVIEYPGDGTEPVTVLEGSELVATSPIPS